MLAIVAQTLTMTGQRYIQLPFYGSIDPEEFLNGQEQMKTKFKLQDFSEDKKISRDVLEFKDYACEYNSGSNIHIITSS